MTHVGTSRLSLSASRRVQRARNSGAFSAGDFVRVKAYRCSPLAGQSGRIAEITPGDPCGPYLVQFGNGLKFRYRGDELVALTS